MMKTRTRRRDEAFTYKYFRSTLFRLVHFGYNYFNPSQFRASWKVVLFTVSYVIRPALGVLVWSTRKRKIDVLIKRSAQRSTESIEEQIVKTLKNGLNDECIQVDDDPWDKDRDDGERPVIVFCAISSRIGTDIENAMRGVHGSSLVILVLLHSVLKDLLRGDLSDDEELLDTTMKNRMKDIAHFAFSDREGLYVCDQNTTGMRRLFCSINSLPSRA